MIKLIEPAYGRLVILQVLREELFLRDMSIRMLTAIANGEKINLQIQSTNI